MFFRPSFCANCGERIERTDWGIFTSRRFCQVCESEFKGHDLIPRAIVTGGVVLGIFGLGSLLRNGPPTDAPIVQQTQAKAVQHAAPPASPAAQPPTVAAENIPQTRALASVPANSAVKPKLETGEVAYYCGAETKKGTPCTRRVKGNVRCFQHKGMPAMLPPEKLRIG
ncbi:MAG: hypothetical protein JO053_09150 [Acidobacteria bacterium]|nr:hypothetical protein [Acidobacteriota bacterium]